MRLIGLSSIKACEVDLVSRDLPKQLEDLIALTFKVDTLLREDRGRKCQPVLAPHLHVLPAQTSVTPPEYPMQIRRVPLHA